MARLLLAALLFLQANNGTVTGRLLTIGGTPAASVRVTLKPIAASPAALSQEVLVSLAQTDNAGRYRLENVPPGSYYITAGLVDVPTYFPGTTAIGEARPISVTAGALVDVPDFAVRTDSLGTARPPALPLFSNAAAIADWRLLRSSKLATSISIDADNDVRSVYEDIGKRTGVSILFDQRVLQGAQLQLKLQNVTAMDAFDRLSSQSRNTWVPLDRDTVIVGPVGALDLVLQLPTRILPGPSIYPGFSPKQTSPMTFIFSGPGRDAFEAIAHAAGLTVVFDRDLRSSPVQLNLDNADIYSALDILSVQLGKFWVPINKNTIFISDDNLTKHRDYDLAMMKTFYLANVKTPQEVSAAVNEVRRVLSPRTVLGLAQWNALLVVDSPGVVAEAEKLIADFDKTPAVRGDAELLDAAGNLSLVENGDLRNVTPYRSRLHPGTNAISVDVNRPTHDVYEKLGAAVGISTVFDCKLRFNPVISAMKLEGDDLFTALDKLSMQTRTFWTPLDDKTIFVTDNNSTNHRDYDPQILKVFYLNPGSPQDLNDMMNLLRQANLSPLVYSNIHANALAIRGTPGNVALAEVLISQIQANKPGVTLAVASQPVRSAPELEIATFGDIYIRETSGWRNITPSRTPLQPPPSEPINIQMKEDARVSFETLAHKAGLQVQFDSSFIPGAPFNFHVEGKTIVDALNALACETRSFWQTIDSTTILVASASPAVRQKLEPQIQKTIRLSGIKNAADVNDLAVAVGGMILSTSSVTPNIEISAIEVRTTANNMELAERLIHALDLP